MSQLNLFGDLFAPPPVPAGNGKAKNTPSKKEDSGSEEAITSDQQGNKRAEPAILSSAELVTEAVQSAVGANFQVEAIFQEEANGTKAIQETAAVNISEEVLGSYVESGQVAVDAERPFVYNDGIIAVKIKAKPVVKVEPAKVPIAKKPKVRKPPQKRGRKSFKEIDAEADLIELPDDETLFQKQYYPISEVAKWFRVNTSLIRFWSNEFDILKPRKNRKGDRLFRPEDVKNLQLIYQLLRVRKFSIDGARDFIKANKKKADTQLQLTQTLQKFKGFLLELKANLQV